MIEEESDEEALGPFDGSRVSISMSIPQHQVPSCFRVQANRWMQSLDLAVRSICHITASTMRAAALRVQKQFLKPSIPRYSFSHQICFKVLAIYQTTFYNVAQTARGRSAIGDSPLSVVFYLEQRWLPVGGPRWTQVRTDW